MIYEQIGFKGLDVKGITIHNTGNKLSAKEIYDYIETSGTNHGCHYLVDEKETIQVLPLDYCTYHTGKGLDFGNTNTIAIEICRSQSDIETYLKAQKRAIELIKDLMSKYGLTNDQVFFHNSFNERTYCPHRILDIYKSRKEFIDKELWQLK